MSNATISEPSPNVPVAAQPGAAKGKARPFLILAVVVLVLGAIYAAFRVLTGGRENTDDAQVSSDMVPLAARVSGVVLAVPVTDHQRVKKGDLIAQIDPADYQTKVKGAEAELAAAKASADAAEAQVRIVEASSKGGLAAARGALSGSATYVAGADAQIAAARAMVDKAQADAQKVDNDLRRAEALRKDDAIPQAQVDSLRANAASQRAAVAQANAQLLAAQESKTTAQTRVAEAAGRVEQSAPIDAQLAVAKANADLAKARVQSAEASLAQAQLNLGYTKVLAPDDGNISKLAVHPGQLVGASQVVTMVLPAATFVVANFKETQVGAMHAGQSATVTIDAFPGRTFHAKVDSVAHGTGAQFSLLPPDNASGNFVKVVQRVPVKLAWTDLPNDIQLEAGLSVDVTVNVK